jgi:two-component system cell cycle response regulator
VEGVEAARQSPPDLILCDVQLPDIDGIEVARRIKADDALRTIPLVAVTAYAMVGDRDQIMAAGFEGYLSKPIDPERFVSQVEEFLAPEQRVRRSPPAAESTPSARSETAPVPATAAEARCAPCSRGATLLIMDDSHANLGVFRSTFEPFGYQVIDATGVSEALRLARKHSPDLIVSDVHVRTESGYDFLRAVKADPALARIPFIYLSSTVWQDTERQMGLALGAVRFLLRPIDPETLVAEVEACLENAGRPGEEHGDDPHR